MLTRIDECLTYLDSNVYFRKNFKESFCQIQVMLAIFLKSSHKDSAQYHQICIQVLRKALLVIKNYTQNSLVSITNQIVQSVQESSDPVVRFSADNAYTTFYSKFRVNSTRIKTLMEQLEQRVELNNQPDYEQALGECHRCYIAQRKVLILGAVVNAIDELVKKHQRDTCSLVRSSCSFIIHLCQDESQLYNYFFGKKSIFFE